MTAGRGLSNSRLEGVNVEFLSTSGRSASNLIVAHKFKANCKKIFCYENGTRSRVPGSRNTSERSSKRAQTNGFTAAELCFSVSIAAWLIEISARAEQEQSCF